MKTKTMLRWLPIALCGSCVFNVTPLSATRTEVYTGAGFDTVAVSSGPDLRQVTIHGNAVSTLQVSATIESLASANTTATANDLAQITFAQSGSVVTPTLALTGAVSPESTQIVLLAVQMPASAGVQYDGSSADVRVDGMTGPLELHLTSGNVDAVTTGTANVNVTSGNTTVQAGGAFAVESTSGNVQVSGSGGTVHATSGNVGITWAGTTLVPLQVDATSGDVSITVPANTGFHVQIDDTSGGIDVASLGLAASSNSGDGHHVDADVHGGGPITLVVRTTSGNVRVATAP